MNPIWTSRVMEKATNHIYIQKELISSASEKVNKDGVEMGGKHPLEADYKQHAHKLVDILHKFHASSHSRESEESQDCHNKRYAIDETIKTLVVQLCMLGMKAGRKEVGSVIITIRRDGSSEKAFLKHIRHLADCKEILQSIVQNFFVEYVFEKQAVQTKNRKFDSRIHVRAVLMSWKIILSLQTVLISTRIW